MRVNSKTEFMRLWKAGALGNRPAGPWNTLAEYGRSGYRGPTSVRSLKAMHAKAQTHLAPYAAIMLFNELGGEGHAFLAESMPDELLLVQGEVGELPAYAGGLLEARINTTPGLNMRTAMRDSRVLTGPAALYLLETRCSPNSYEDIRELLELFPGHIIEFSAYAIDVGHQPRRNTIIWEVRDY